MFDFIKIPDKMKKVLIRDKDDRKKIEKLTNTTITIEDDIKIEGDGLEVYQAKQVLKAFGRGFSINDSLCLLDDDCGFEIINLPDLIKSDKRIIIVKSRIIGTEGKTKKLIEKYTKTKLAISGKTVSILGKWDKINLSKEAVMKIVDGCSHSVLYKWLERQYSEVNKW